MEGMNYHGVMQFVVAFCLFAVALSMPRHKRLFLDVNCDQPVACPRKATPICCTDGNTYNSQCEVDLENQRRICHEGKFNPIVMVHMGPCSTTAPPKTQPTTPSTTSTTTSSTTTSTTPTTTSTTTTSTTTTSTTSTTTPTPTTTSTTTQSTPTTSSTTQTTPTTSITSTTVSTTPSPSTSASTTAATTSKPTTPSVAPSKASALPMKTTSVSASDSLYPQ